MQDYVLVERCKHIAQNNRDLAHLITANADIVSIDLYTYGSCPCLPVLYAA